MNKRAKIQHDTKPQWPFISLRDYLAYLEERGRLLHVERPVDAKWEISAVSRTLFDQSVDKACVFWNVHSSADGWHVEPPFDVAVEGTHRTMKMMEEILNTTKQKIFDDWVERVANLVEPVVVDDAPCKEVVIKGDGVDLLRIPVEVSGANQGGPFISIGVAFIKHPESKLQNMGVYRLHVKSKDHTAILIVPHQHVASLYAEYGVRGRPMPMAVAIGVDPLLPIIGAAPFPYKVSEMYAWGGLTGRPLEVVKCETIDVCVPAFSEYVLEGEVLQDVRDSEGPFGEYTGFYSGIRDLPVFKVKCITHRRKPLYETVNIGKPPSEANFLTEMGFSLELTRAVKQYLPEVTAVRSVMAHGLVTAIQVDKKRRYKGIAQRAGNMVWTMKSHVKNVFVIDNDIDIWSPDDILWAFATRCQANKSVHIVPNVSGVRLDPSEPYGGEEGISAKLVIDCTEPFPPYHAPYMRGVAWPKVELMEKVKKEWNQYFLQ